MGRAPFNFLWILICFCSLLNNNTIGLIALDCAVVIDAGSTGTTVFIYGWNHPKQIQLLDQTSNESPIANINDLNQTYHLFSNLIYFAKNVTSIHCSNSPPIYIKATAGMRLLTVPEQDNVLYLINEVMINQSFNPFLFEKGYASVISGKEEGLFEWISVNYKNTKNSKNTFGVVTSGGASIQFAFMYFENDTDHNHFVEYGNFTIYSQSYLGLGHREMKNKVIQLCYDKAILNNNTKIENPCLFKGYYNEDCIPQFVIFGTGQPHQCRNIIKQIFHLNGINIYQPKLPPYMTFYATQYLAEPIQHLNLTKDVDLYNISQITFNLCTKNVTQFKNKAPDLCFDAIYSLYLLSDIFKFPEINTPIIFTENINYSWTLGFLYYDMNIKTAIKTSQYQTETERSFIIKLNHFVLICVGSFIAGIIFIVILMYSHKCCSCCKKNEYEVVNTTESESESEISNLTEPELEITNIHIYILFLNTFATYSLHRFIGRYSIYFAEAFGITFLEVGYLQIALYLGHIISVFFPSILQSNYFISTHLSYKMLFFSFKIALGISTLAYIIYHPFWFLFITRFLFGLIRCLYCVFRTTFIAINEKKINKQLWIFSFFSLHKPIGLLLLTTFGVILVYLSFQIAIFLLVLPCLVLSFLFLIYFPKNTIKIDENNSVSNNEIANIQQNNSINVSIISNEHVFGNLGQIGLILGVLFGGILLEMFNICLSAWYHHTFNLNASEFWIVVIAGASAEIITFFLLTNMSKICTYYNPNNNGAILYFIACCIESGAVLFLFLFITYSEIDFVLSLICVGIFNVGACAAPVAGNLLSVNLVTNKQDKSKLNAGMKSAFAFGMLIGSFLGPFLFTMNNFKTVMLVANIAGFGSILASGLIIIHNRCK